MYLIHFIWSLISVAILAFAPDLQEEKGVSHETISAVFLTLNVVSAINLLYTWVCDVSRRKNRVEPPAVCVRVVEDLPSYSVAKPEKS